MSTYAMSEESKRAIREFWPIEVRPTSPGFSDAMRRLQAELIQIHYPRMRAPDKRRAAETLEFLGYPDFVPVK